MQLQIQDIILCKFTTDISLTLVAPKPINLYISVWIAKPSMVSVDTMTYPLEKLKFPTVTLCPMNSNPDRWGPAIKILDMIKRCPNNG